MADNIPGTNIPKSAVANNIKGDWQYWADRLRGSDNPNDVLFSMAYTTPFSGMESADGNDVWQGQGQGNPNVGALQSNIWSLTGDQPSWAEEAVQNPGGRSDIYQDRSDPNNVTAVAGADYGQAASADDMARAGTNLAGQSHFFYGTNMPTTGFTATQINDFNNRLRTEIDSQNWRGANDAMFDIAWQMGKSFYGSPTDDQGGYGQGNKFVGMLQSDMFSLTDPAASMWGEDYINSENDVYTLRDLSGNPRGETIRYDDTAGSYIDTGGAGGAGGGLLGNAPFQDWSRFMPTETPYYQLGEFAGAHYQPWATGTPLGGPSYSTPRRFIGPSGSIQPYTGGATGPGSINPNIWGGTDTSGGGNTVTDSSGNQWVMTPQGNWVPATSDYGEGLLGTGRLYPDYNFYDSSGAFVGAEGEGVRGNQAWGGGAFSDMERLTGIAGPNVPGMGNRQVGLNLLDRLGIFNNVGTFPVASLGTDAIDLGGYGPEGADGQGESEVDIQADIDATEDGGLVA